MKKRIIHCFNWKVRDIIQEVRDIQEQGFTDILISPVQPLKEPLGAWWLLYQPCNMTVGNCLGDYKDIRQLCNVAHERGLRVIVDVVLNHVANKTGLDINDKVDDFFKKEALYKENVNVQDWNDRYCITHQCIGMRCLNLAHTDLQRRAYIFLKQLIYLGVDGFRLDAAKHIALPEEFNGENQFFKNVVERLHNEYGVYFMGEVLHTDAPTINMYNKYVDVLTNTTGIEHNKIVTFAESHDTFLNTDGEGYTRNTAENIILEDYKQLVKYYPKTLFYVRPFSNAWKRDDIRQANLI
jgi:Glycosidases